MTESGASLAVLLRQTQWMLDDVTRQASAGQLTPAKAEELATILDDLAVLVRRHGGTLVIDSIG